MQIGDRLKDAKIFSAWGSCHSPTTFHICSGIGDEEGYAGRNATAEGGDHSGFKVASALHSLNKVQPCDPLHSLLIEFEDLFVEPSTLPPN